MATTDDLNNDGMSAEEFARTCRRYVGSRGHARLVELAESEDPKTAMAALKLLAAYAYGLPAAQVVVENRLIDPAHVLPEAEAAQLRELYRRELREARMRELPSLTRVK